MPKRTVLLSLLFVLALASPAWAGAPTMPLGQVARGMHCTGYSVVQGTTISSFNVDVVDVIVGLRGEQARILVKVSGPAIDASGIAQGFSGSPVYCTDAAGVPRVIGAISETVGEYGEKVGLVTPIEQILGAPVSPPPTAHYRPALLRSAKPAVGPLTVSGVSPDVAAVVNAAGARGKRRLIATPAVGPLASFAPQPLVPGASVSVGFANGDVAVGAIGTITYADGPNVWLFGHPLDSAGARSLLLQDAYVYTVINNPVDLQPLTSFKLAAPGHDLGQITNDTPNTVAGVLGQFPAVTMLHVGVQNLDTGQTNAVDTSVADETDVGIPEGSSAIGPVGVIALAQGVTVSLQNVIGNQSGRMCIDFVVAEVPKPLHFCNRYVTPATGGLSTGVSRRAALAKRKTSKVRPAPAAGPNSGGGSVPGVAAAAASDYGNAVTALDSVLSSALHVTSIDAELQVSNNLSQAFIVSAQAPRVARPGQRITVSLTVQRVRGAVETRSYKLKVPHGAKGATSLSLTGTGPDGGGGGGPAGSQPISVTLGNMLGADPSQPQQDPGDAGPNPADLSTLFQGFERFDGVSADFIRGAGGHHKKKKRRKGKSKSSAGGGGSPAFTDPTLRIGGQTTVPLRVR